MSRFFRTLLACAIVMITIKVGEVMASAVMMGFDLKADDGWLKFLTLGTVFGILYTIGTGTMISLVAVILDKVLGDEEEK